jgi:hypothetical protein
MSKSELSYLFESNYFQNLHHLLENLRTINTRKFMFAVPTDLPPELVKNMAAASLAYFLGVKSIDNTVKQYGAYLEIDDRVPLSKQDKEINYLFQMGKKEIERVKGTISGHFANANSMGAISASAALARLETGFRASGLLIRLGCIFEASSLCRMILEQIAWAYSVHELDDEKIFRLSPRKAVKNLKNLLPYAGKTYGFLSKYTHLEPELISQYLILINQEFSVNLVSFQDRLSWAWAHLYLVDSYSVVSEYIFRNSLSEFRQLDIDGTGKFIASSKRPLYGTLKKYQALFPYSKNSDCTEA